MSTMRRTVIALAVILALVLVIPFAVRSTQSSRRDLDRGLQSIQRTR